MANPSVIDLLKVMSIFKYNAVSYVTFLVHITKKSSFKKRLSNAPLMQGCALYDADLMGVMFGNESISAKSFNHPQYIVPFRQQDLSSPHFACGKVLILLDEKQSYENEWLYVRGRIGLVYYCHSTYFIGQFKKVQAGYQIGAVDVISKPSSFNVFDSYVEESKKAGVIRLPAEAINIPKVGDESNIVPPYKPTDFDEPFAQLSISVPPTTTPSSTNNQRFQEQNNSFTPTSTPTSTSAPAPFSVQTTSIPTINAENKGGFSSSRFVNSAPVSNNAGGMSIQQGGVDRRLADGRLAPVDTALDRVRYDIYDKVPIIENLADTIGTRRSAMEEKFDRYDMNNATSEDKDIYIDLINRLADMLLKNWSKVTPTEMHKRIITPKRTGREIFIKAMSFISDDMTDLTEKILQTYDEKDIVETWKTGVEQTTPFNKRHGEFFNILTSRQLEVLVALWGAIFSFKRNVVSVYRNVTNSGYNFLALLTECPYKLCYFDASITLADLDKLAMLGGHFYDETSQVDRDIAQLHLLMSDENTEFLSGSTTIKADVLQKIVRLGYRLTPQEYMSFRSNMHGYTDEEGNAYKDKGCIYTDTLLQDVETYLPLVKHEACLPLAGWERTMDNAYCLPSKESMEDAYQAYIKSGLGVEYFVNGKKSVTDFLCLHKEMYIYNKVYEMVASAPTVQPTRAEIDEYIDAFEQAKTEMMGLPESSPFKLEDRQREAVHLVGTPVFAIIGGAGCGKTTTAEAVVDVLMKVYNLKEEEVRFVAPTGKAANRLKESIKRDTSTIHSLCGIFGGIPNVFAESHCDRNEKRDTVKAIVVDESSMINLDVAYDLFTFLRKDTVLIFLGDTGQLPPIGFGKVFSDILNYIPCITLNVSKRASAKSGITRNATLIAKNSDANGKKMLEESDDFKLIETSTREVPALIDSLVKYHLGMPCGALGKHIDNGVFGRPLTPDDIQIVTPVRNKKHSWSSENLNPIVQEIVNPCRKGVTAIGARDTYAGKGYKFKYHVGDRVIHLSNTKEMPRWLWKDGGTLEKAETKGVMNGDVGKIRNIYIGDNECLELQKAGAIDVCAEDTVAVEVEYEDVGTESADGRPVFSIFYTTKAVMDKVSGMPMTTDGGNGGTVVEVRHGMLYDISLAYALTVHKMQGSQATLIIIPYFNLARQGFLSRNMLYTAVTRAVKGCYIIGEMSAVDNSRNNEVVGKRFTAVYNMVHDADYMKYMQKVNTV